MKRADLFQTADRRTYQFFRALDTLHIGVWLGLLDRQTFHQISNQQYQAWEPYQDRDYNLSGLQDWEEKAVEQSFRYCRSVLLGAAGGGREIIALSRRQIRVDAFECCPSLVTSCQQLLEAEGVSARVIHSLPDQVPEEFGVYDGFIMGWGAYSHIPGRESRIAFLEQCRRHIRPGGPILLSFSTGVHTSRQARWVQRIAQALRRLRRCQEPVELGDSLSGTLDHYFTKHEIESELAAAGFAVEHCSDDPFGHAIGRSRSD